MWGQADDGCRAGVPCACRARTKGRLCPSVALLLGVACGTPGSAAAPQPTLRLASTYAVEEPGLFAILSPEFSARTQRTLAPTFVGSGEALELAKVGQADVVWSHSRPSEDAFISEGYGLNRRDVMYSEFVIVGPSADPAKISGSGSAVEALTRLSRARAPFVSRGDQSGTQLRELALWKLAGIEPDPSWYTSLHAGTVATLSEASKRRAYALSDLPTFLMQEHQLALQVLVRGDSRLHNPYGVIAVNPDRFPDTDYEGAMAFIDFLTSAAGQAVIADYGRELFGTSLFHPLADRGGID